MKEKPTEKQLFDALISQTAYGIWVSLGKLQNPVSGETSIDLTQASIQIAVSYTHLTLPTKA